MNATGNDDAARARRRSRNLGGSSRGRQARGRRSLGRLARSPSLALLLVLGACGSDELQIHDVQGDGNLSPLDGRGVAVEGVVTARVDDGFFLQSPDSDWSRRTSEALFVAFEDPVRSGSRVPIGSRVRVSGTVAERARNDRELSVTTLLPDEGAAIEILDERVDLPKPIRLSSLPASVSDALGVWEALEGMLVELPGGLVVGPTDRYGVAVLLLDRDGARALPRTPANGLALVGGDEAVPFPFRVTLDDAISPMPALEVGDRLEGPILGVVDYRYGTYRLLPLETPAVSEGPDRTWTAEPTPEGWLSFATFNVENLDLGDEPARFRRLAAVIVDALGAPDVVGLQEVQDDSGPVDDGVVSSEGAHRRLLASIVDVGGPAYLFRDVRPLDNQDGGAPGANIRVSLLVRKDRGVAVVDRAGEDPARQTAVAGLDETGRVAVSPSPGRLGLGEAAFRDTRKPLVVQLEVDGEPLFVIVCHLSSKRSDDLPFGSLQPPEARSEPQRIAQARVVAGFVSDILRLDPAARLVVLGDFNDFPFSRPLDEIEAAGLRNALLDLPPEERYTYVHQGVSQALDHVLLSPGLLGDGAPKVAIAHVNAEQPASRRTSDHDPVVVRLPRRNAGGRDTDRVEERTSATDPVRNPGSEP